MKSKAVALVLVGIIFLTGCNTGVAPIPTPTQPALLDFDPTATPFPLAGEIFTPTATPIPPVSPTVCTDPQVVSLIDSFKRSMLTADGPLLSSLISPKGMETRYFRNGNIVAYAPDQASFLFETTYQANWGNDPASGVEKSGSFHEVVVPELIKIFNQPYTLHCNEIRHGGASYVVTWPYDRDFYSIYYAGTEANGYLDWHTWVLGVEYLNNKPLIYALMQFYWEP